MGTYLVWFVLGLAALVVLIVAFTLFAKDNGRGPGPGRKRRGDDGDNPRPHRRTLAPSRRDGLTLTVRPGQAGTVRPGQARTVRSCVAGSAAAWLQASRRCSGVA